MSIERAGWFAPHPLKDEPVHVVTREWFEEILEQRNRLLEAAGWLLKCHDDVERQVPVRGYDEAWEGLRHALGSTRRESA